MHKKMMHGIAISLAIPLLLTLQISSVRGYIETINISTDSREHIEFESFGFTTNGRLSISISSVFVTTNDNKTPTNSSRFGFYTAPIAQDVNPNINCENENVKLTKIFTFSELSPPPQSSVSKTITVTKPGHYNIVFGNCNPGSYVSMLVHIEAYNLDAEGRKDYLSDGETQLPTVFATFALCYVPFFIIWLHKCHSNKPYVKKIHILMAVLLFFKALNLALGAEERYHVKIWGAPRGWDTLFYISHFIKALLLFTITVLIGTGWSFLKPFLQEREKRVLMIGILLQVFANVAYIIFVEIKLYSTYLVARIFVWFLSFFIADTLCGCLIIASISRSMRSIMDISKTDGRAMTNLRKMRLFRNFYLSVLAYLGFKNYLMVFIADNVSVWKHEYLWVPVVFMETASLVFYIIMFYLLRPFETNQYFAVPSDDMEEQVALRTIRSYEFSELIMFEESVV